MLYLYKQSNRINNAMFKGGNRFRMKKSKIAIGIVAGLASVAALASCSEVKPVKSKDGYLLTYKSSSGTEAHYSTNDLFGSYAVESSSISSVFERVYQLIVRNYFDKDNTELKADIVKNAENDVNNVKVNAETNAKTNKTKYADEFEKLLENYSCEDEAELKEHFIYEREETEFQKLFYDKTALQDSVFKDKAQFKVNGQVVNGIHWLRDAEQARDGYEGYLEKKVPYHIRHILVKFTGTSSSNSYWNDTIDSKDAEHLYTLASSLAEASLDFGQIAQNSSEFSDGSAATYGELDIMDKDTSYVNEFKLGIYAYENLYGNNKAAAKSSEISMYPADSAYADIKGQKGLDIAGKYSDSVTYVKNVDTYDMGGDAAGEIATIPYGVFEAIKEYALTTNNSNGEVVNEGNQAFYPRNVLYNKYLNRHQVAFITPNSIPANDYNPTKTPEYTEGEDTVGTLNATYAALGGFNKKYIATDGSIKVFPDENNGVPTDLKTRILCTADGKPIVVVRAGSSEYQGIHFMVIERSPLEDKDLLGKYYTTLYPNNPNDPNDAYVKEVGNNPTYVNAFHQPKTELISRAEKVASKIKNFDSSNFKKEIYSAYVKAGIITFNTPEGAVDLGAEIDKWISVSKEKSEFDTANTWETTWEGYINTLVQQKAERRKLVSEACAIGFRKYSKEEAWTKVGGACYVPTQK